MNIFLIGFMGAGKSTIAKQFAKTHGKEVVEMDERIAKSNGMSISEIFETRGEADFREEETKLLNDLSSKKDVIVSCGGGVAMRKENVDIMKQSGTIVLLSAEPKTILKRVENEHDRPLLENNKTIEHIQELMEARKPFYESAADLVVVTDGKSASTICEEIFKKIQE